MASQKLTKCRDCGEVVSTRAKTCPHCGRPHPQPFDYRVLIGVVTLVLVPYLCVQASKDDTKTEDHSPAPYTHAVFLARLAGGADCEELYRIRNAVKGSGQDESMTRQLGSISCTGPSASRYTGPFRDGKFTLREFRVYAQVATTSESVSEIEALRRAAKSQNYPPSKGESITRKVMAELTRLGRMGVPREAQIKHASDWKDEVE